MKYRYFYLMITVVLLIISCNKKNTVKSEEIITNANITNKIEVKEEVMTGKITNYNLAMKLWKSKNVRNYYIKTIYMAFSPHKGVWETYVKDGNVVKVIKDNKNITDGLNIPPFTVEYLLGIAQNAESDELGYVDSSVVYNQTYGYPELIQFITKPDGPKDKSRSYEVVVFKIEE